MYWLHVLVPSFLMGGWTFYTCCNRLLDFSVFNFFSVFWLCCGKFQWGVVVSYNLRERPLSFFLMVSLHFASNYFHRFLFWYISCSSNHQNLSVLWLCCGRFQWSIGITQQTHQPWINVETTVIVNVHQRCFNVAIWMKMKVEPTYIYRRCFNVGKTTLKQRL